MCVPSLTLMAGLVAFRPTDVNGGIVVTLKVEVTYDPSVMVTWYSEGGLITQCALLVAVEEAREVDIFLLPSFGSFPIGNLTEEMNRTFQLTCFDQSEGPYKSQSFSVVHGSVNAILPPTTIQVNRTDSVAHHNNLNPVAGWMFGSVSGMFVVLICCGLYRKWRPGSERIRALYRFARRNLAIPVQMFDHGGQ